MRKELRTVVYDDELRMEAYRFEGIVQPIDAAMQTDFSDQSHFTNYFSSFLGLAPGIYREVFSEKDKEGEQHGK